MIRAKVSAPVRATLIVSDLDRSRAFYTDVLGLSEVYSEGAITDGNTHELLGAPAGVVVKVCVLNTPGTPPYGMIGLCQMEKPRPARIGRTRQSAHIGELCLVFYARNLDDTAADIRRHGLEITFGPAPVRSGGEDKYRGMTFLGPDSERISLFEWDLDAAQSGSRPEQWVGRSD